MSAQRMDACTGREKDGKTYWTRIGVAFATRQGGWSIKLDALPVNGEIVLFPPKDRDAHRQVPRGGQAQDEFQAPPDDGEIPF